MKAVTKTRELCQESQRPLEWTRCVAESCAATDSADGQATRLWAGHLVVGKRVVCSQKCPDRLWGPPNGYQCSFWRVNRPGRYVDHSPLIPPKLRMSGAIPVLPLYAFLASTGTALLLPVHDG